jgi:WD40 repeat protein
MTRLCFTLLLPVALTAFVAATLAAPVPKVPPDPTKDREGNPLPKGATARLGSHVFCGPTHHNYGFTFSPDGKRILGIIENGFVGWDVGSGKRLSKDASPLFSFKTEGTPQLSGNYFVRFRTNFGPGDAVAGTSITVIDADGKQVSRFDFEPGYSAGDSHTVTPDGKRFVILHDAPDDPRKVWVFELPSGKLLRTHKIAKPLGHICISPDSKTLCVPEQFSPLRRFDLDTGKELAALTSGEEYPYHVLISPDGKTVISTCQPRFSSRPAKFWVLHDPATGKPVGKVEFKGGTVPSPVAFVGPREVIAFTVLPRSAYVLQMFTISRLNLDTMKCVWEMPAPIYGPVLSPDGKRLASTSGAHIILHDVATGKRLDTATGHVGAVGWIGFSRDGQTVMTADTREVMKWSLNGERKSAREPPEHRDRWASHPFDIINPLVWVTSTDGKKPRMVSWDFEKEEIAWRIPLADEVPLADDQGRPLSRLLSHDGKRVLGLFWTDNPRGLAVVVYGGPTGKILHSWALKNTQEVIGLSADGKTLFVRDGELAGLDVETGKETMRTKHKLPTGTLSPDGTRIAHLRQRDPYSPATLVVCDTRTAEEIANYDLGDVPTGGMLLVFSANGKWVAARTGTHVLVYDVGSTTPPRKLDADSTRPTRLAFSPNGASLAVGYVDGTALIWDLTAK